jgi:hypothetical protein
MKRGVISSETGMVLRMTTEHESATSTETREELLRLSGRGYTKVRHVLCQRGDGTGSSVASVLGPMVTDRKRRSLQLYLLLITVWPWLKKQEKPLPAGVWARALETETGRRWTPTNVSEAWADLRERGLVETRRLSKGVVVTPRREDGRADYTEPGETKADHDESYFTLPPSFWKSKWFESLSLPGVAMLLIIASRTSRLDRQETWMTNEDTAKWYGFSPRSVEAGLKELAGVGLLTERVEWVKAPLSAIGSTKRHWYSLNAEFSTAERLKMQDQARQQREDRVGRSSKSRKRTAASRAVKKTAKNAARTAVPRKTTAKKAAVK